VTDVDCIHVSYCDCERIIITRVASRTSSCSITPRAEAIARNKACLHGFIMNYYVEMCGINKFPTVINCQSKYRNNIPRLRVALRTKLPTTVGTGDIPPPTFEILGPPMSRNFYDPLALQIAGKYRDFCAIFEISVTAATTMWFRLLVLNHYLQSSLISKIVSPDPTPVRRGLSPKPHPQVNQLSTVYLRPRRLLNKTLSDSGMQIFMQDCL